MGEVVQLQATALDMAGSIDTLKAEMLKLEQFEPETKNIFHGGMYCRQVLRPAGCLIVGKVHKKEHFYFVVSGTILVTTDEGPQNITGPYLLCSTPGTQRAVYAQTDALCMTFHRTDAITVEDAELDLVEEDLSSPFGPGNKIKSAPIEVSPCLS
jgi:hypothetical protein